MSASREMTLDEWCAKLPDFHRVNKELRELKAGAAAERERLAKLAEEGQDNE